MTDTLTTDPRTRARAHEMRGTRTSAYALFVQTWKIGVYFWIAVVLISIALTVVLDRWSDISESVADGLLGSAPIFLSVMGVILPLALLPLHLAGGATRRSFVRGIVLCGAALGVSFAFVGAVGMLVESVVFDTQGWSTSVEDPGLYDSSGDFFGIWLSWSLSGFAYFLAGTALALGYYRWGAWLGTAFMLVAVALVVVGEVMLGGGIYSVAFDAVVGDVVPALLGVVVSLAVSAALAGLVHRALRDIALRSSTPACR